VGTVWALHRLAKEYIDGEALAMAVFCVVGLLLLKWENVSEKLMEFISSPALDADIGDEGAE
jgi:hypothetical protein